MLSLTAEDKIVINLGALDKFKDDVEAPFETTQEGLASNLGLRRSHVSIALSGLKKKDMVTERLSHVKKSARRKKVYFLTGEGLRYSDNLKRRLEEQEIIFKEGTKEKKMMFKDLVKTLPRKASLTEIIANIRNDVFDLGLLGVSEEKDVDFSGALPQIRYFFGREDELKTLNGFADSKTQRIFALKGIAGIGKTTLLTKFASDIKTKNIFMYRVCEWSTLGNILRRLAEFSASKGRRALYSYLKSQDVPNIEDAVNLICKDISSLRTILIFDDGHNANESIVMFLKAFCSALHCIKDLKLIVSGRTIPTFYSRKDAKVKRTVVEMTLKGLDEESAKEILRTQREGKPDNFARIYKLTKGHPLFLELLALNGAVSTQTDAKRFIHEEIYSKLKKDEKKIMCMAAVFRYPMKPEALVGENETGYDFLEELADKSLIHQSGNVFELHDILKEFFYSRLTGKMKKECHHNAAEYYQEEEGALADVESIYHLIKADEFGKASKNLINEGMNLIIKGYQEELMELIKNLKESKIKRKDWIKILFLKGEILTMRGDWKGAQRCYTEAHAISREINDTEGLAQASYELGVMHYRRGEWKKALERYQKALDLSKKEGLKERQAKLYNTMGIVHWRNGDLRNAADFYKESIKIYRELKDDRGIAGGYNNLGIVHWELNEMDKALEYYLKSLKISQKAEDKRTVAILYNNIGEIYRVRNEKDEALRYFEKSLELSKELEFKWQIAEVYRNLGRISRGKNRKEHLKNALELFNKLGAKKDVEEVKKMIKK